MTASLRLLALAIVLAYSVVLAGSAAAARTTRERQRALRLRVHRHEWLKVKKIPRPVPLGVRAVDYARRFLGVPYVYGGSSPSGFDCSGLVRYVYGRFGIDLPHSSYADFDLGRRVARQALKPGDLVFFDGVGHVGMYVGGGRFIHAPHTGTRVEISTLASYSDSFDGARRIVSGVKRVLLGG